MSHQITAHLVDLHLREIYLATVSIDTGKIVSIDRVPIDRLPPATKTSDASALESLPYLMPGFVDAHIHVESSMLMPNEFARVAVGHGTVATVSDPHEIANVCGVAGVELMLENASQVNFKFMFGAPSCVPATSFETAGAVIDAAAVEQLMGDDRIGYLSEVMDFPAVLRREEQVMSKIKAAQKHNKPVDGHAPGLRGSEAASYIAAGISTDHECVTLEEALDKISCGCKIAIREGSAARNFDALYHLIKSHPQDCMLCSDDKHPDEFLLGHINQLAARAVARGCDLMDVLTVACLNPVDHYRMDVGTLKVGDPADFIVVQDLTNFQVRETYINGEKVFADGKCLIPTTPTSTINHFVASPVTADQLVVKSKAKFARVIVAVDGQLVTHTQTVKCLTQSGNVVADFQHDVLKIVVVNRYNPSLPKVALVSGFGLTSGALASSVAHDSHNIIAVGTNDQDIATAINRVIADRGGLAVSRDGQADGLPLPVAGLMAVDSCDVVAAKYSQLDAAVKSMGTSLRSPFMTLSFMALLVIPSLKISDKGLFDVDQFDFVPLFV